ncbi:MAG: hypothetical protein A2Y24_00765 [Clostridiales bacterium GWE2_32_10]|nr:MAG: hypothetical protein A2Y24_00765 [Clostridiales bacterium GWE2_32_10]
MSILNSIKNKFASNGQYDNVKDIEESNVFDELSYVEKLCQKSIQLSNMRAKKAHTLEHYIETLKSIDAYEKIDEDTMKKIDKHMEEYNKLKQNKDVLKNHLLENGKKYEHLSHFSYKDIENEISDIKVLEKEQGIVKKDLDYLRGEREDILQSNEQAENILKIVKALIHFTIFAVSIVTVTFVALFSVMQESILIPASIVTVIVIFWSTWLYMFSNRLYADIVKYRKLQSREIQLSNKVKLKYIEVASALDLKYKKYNIRSAEMLKYDWEKYQETLDKRYEYNKVFHEFFDIEESLQEILNKKGIKFDEDINMIELISNIKEKLRFKYELQHKIKSIKNEIETMDNEQAKIKWSLKDMENKDKTEQKVIKNIIESYFKDVDGIGKNLQT